jgi:hypothetical protein
MKDIIKLGVTLFSICAVAGLVLAFTNNITSPVNAATQYDILGIMFFPSFNKFNSQRGTPFMLNKFTDNEE